ncbi:hemicentin-1 isoform X1 [Bombyx mori]|uniref:Ig-like domain-containing protein n=1 Tax=Bombyx mori TaxID=7091 RepID=A0A8R2R382_BOMMO|nr:hemicentin-1 isoform X1 [Bombyx mori]XP_037871100.1 hemicentin-1 isoform X1 [Bombyx mori]XP_037871101.1 hemicentin-1 isoform X1 [Bombyx mori]XP_037871102.1 hemicentin-1 isoform X1 [Bombyx mori]
MHIAVGAQRTLLAFVLLALSNSPSATQNTFITGSPMSSVTGTVTRVAAVVGGEANLPCDSRPPQRNDSMLLVVWYRDDNPVYSYDTRVLGPSAHWTDEPFANRARWYSTPSSGLHVDAVQARDRAVYRCRVDFQISPTRNYRIALDVIELPNKPVIFDEFGKEISGAAGPYNEGGDFKLICSVNGGTPTPRVQWLHGDTVLTTLGASDLQPSGMTRTLVLVVKNATRLHLSAVYTCTADNTLLSTPQKTSVRVDLYLRPLSVEILSKEQPLSVGRKTELWCRSTGARPPANITWWLDGKQLHSIGKQKKDTNESQSLLEWVPMKEHNGKVLTCRAEHVRFNHSTIESKLPLNIYYVPITRMELGSKMNPNDIEEGDDVYFGCDVDANPPAYKVIWEHNEVLLQHNPSNGVILTGNTNLAVRNVSRHQAGNYTCTASNVEGDGKSPPLHLQIVYKPLCRKREMKMIGAALQEPTKVICEVDAYPPPNTFEWTLNSSAGSIRVDAERFTVEVKEGRSVLTYMPVSDVDYGTLSCRATNLAGQQPMPCLYTLLPATRPDQPTNCTVYNLTDDSLDLACIAGYEGGLRCVYVLEVWTNEGLLVNVSNGAALWNLRRLGAARLLRLVVYAANSRGRSEHVSFTVETAPRLAPRTEAQAAWEVNWAVGGALCFITVIGVIVCLAMTVFKLRNRARDYEVTIPSLKNQKVLPPKRNSPHGQDDRNPDIIPLSKGLAGCPPDPPMYSAVTSSDPKNSNSAHSLSRTLSPTTPASSHAQYADTQSESSRNGANGVLRSHREVVTTRTPLLAAHQESCV